MRTKTDADKLNSIVENNAFNETVSTEITYNQSLTLLDLILHNHNVSDNKVLSTLKPLIAALKTISDKLLDNVDKAVKTETTDGTILREQRPQLLTAFFAAYKDYVELYQQFSTAYKENRSQFKKIIAYIRGEQRLENEENPKLADTILELIVQTKRLDLQSHLIQPIQRGPRYLLLLSAIEDENNNLDETNIQELKELKTIVANFLSSINNNGLKSNSKKTYKFGDYSNALLDWIATLHQPVKEEQSSHQPVEEEQSSHQPETTKEREYQFGDLSKSAYAYFFGKPASEQTSNPQQTEEHKQDNKPGLTLS